MLVFLLKLLILQLLEDFASHAVEIGENLNEFGYKMGETELPLDVIVTKTLLQSQQAVSKYHKVGFAPKYM